MKKKHAVQYFCFLLLVAISTAFTPAEPPPNNEECQLNVQRAVSFGLQQSIHAAGNFTSTQEPSEMIPGTLELCVDKEGTCTWTFTNDPTERYLVEIPALKDLVQMVFTSEVTIDDYIGKLEKGGASITDLGNNTLSITQENQHRGLTVITLVDVSKRVILGSNIYQNNQELTTKVICRYDMGNIPRLQTLSLLIWEDDTLTEMVFKNF